MNTGIIRANRWTAEETKDHSLKMAEAFKILRKRAMARYGEPSLKQLRYDYLQGRHVFRYDPEAKAQIDWLLSKESEIISAHILMVGQLANSFYLTNRKRFPHLTEDEYTQEGAWAVSDAMYLYDGSTCFSTYSYNAVKKRLSNFIRSQESLARIGRPVKIIRRRLEEIMRSQLCTFQQAVAILRKEEPLSDEMVAKARDAIYNVRHIEHSDNQAFVVHGHEGEIALDRSERQAALIKAIEDAGLTPLERELVEAVLEGNDSFRSGLVESRINPNTGEFYTRQALSQAYKRACGKLREVMEGTVLAAA